MTPDEQERRRRLALEVLESLEAEQVARENYMDEMIREIQILRSILRRVMSLMWWARLYYPDNRSFWTEEEAEVLKRVHGGQPHD